ncbi:MAG: TlyA family RNA methyltransferase [Chloroflexota bacterium]
MSAKAATKRLDELVVERGLAETRTRAQAVIMAGTVTVDGQVATKAGKQVPVDAPIELVHQPVPYVSRGGLKLDHALQSFGMSVSGQVTVDVGASTGGFTDVLLEGGAKRVYAIDVGYGQLAWKLRNDERVVVMERTNIRHVEDLPEPIDLAVVDASFISLRLILPALAHLVRQGGEVVALIKPQFEAGKELVGKHGVVRNPSVWRQVLADVLRYSATNGWSVLDLTTSPIRGPAGNVEFLVRLSLSERGTDISDDRLAELIDGALPGPG